MAKISCVMPNHNNCSFLAQSIRSILDQTVKDLELIIVDDCSTDGSVDLIKHFAKDKRLKYFVMERRLGAGACRNFGNNKAKAPVILVMDSGDISHRYRSKASLDFFRKNQDIHIYSSACVEIDATDTQIRTHEPRPFSNEEKPSLFHPTVAYRKEVPKMVKYREGNVATDQYEVFFFEAFNKGFNFGFNHDYWVKKLYQKKDPEAVEMRMKQRVKNYKEFGIEVPKELERFHEK